MKKTAIASAIALSMGIGVTHAAGMASATFTMLDSAGSAVGTDTSVTGSIGGGSWSVASTVKFFGKNWTAHGGTTFGPGTYSFATIEGGTYTGVVVGTGQVGGHILFDWGVTANIDVINVWNVSGNTYTSTDATVAGTINDTSAGGAVGPDMIRGVKMIDGAFTGYNANFDFTTAVPVPAAVWLFGSGLLGLVGVARRKKAA